MKMFADWLDRAAQDSVVILIFETRVMCLSAALKNNDWWMRWTPLGQLAR
jgi:hypothetical protein